MFYRLKKIAGVRAVPILATIVLSPPVLSNSPEWTTVDELGAYDGSMEKLAGIWSADCTQNDAAFYIINRTHVLDIGPDAIYHYELTDGWLNDPDASMIVSGSTAEYSYPTEDGSQRVALERCNQLPPKTSFMHGEAISFMQKLPKLQEACANERSECVNTFLDITDMAQTGGINEADLARMIRVASYFGAIEEDGVKATDLTGNQAIAVGVGPLAANLIIRSYDYDADDQITPSELAVDRGTLFGIGGMDVAGDAVEGVDDQIREQLNQLKNLMQLFQ